MTQVASTPRIRNGVNIDQMFGTLDAVRDQPSLARFQFRARNTWMGGSHNQSFIRGFFAANQEDQSRTSGWTLDAGEPGILLGTDEGPNPAEYLLHALAACLTTSLVYVAAARGVQLEEVESMVEGNLDVQGALGLDDSVRNGYGDIKVTFRVKADAPPEKVREIVERAQARSSVFDSITRGVPVTVEHVAA